MSAQIRPFIESQWVDGGATMPAYDTYSAEAVADVHEATADQVHQATRAVAEAQRSTSLSPHERYRILARSAELVIERSSQIAESIVVDTGFTITDATKEVQRCAETLLLSGEEAKRLTGAVVPVGSDPSAPARVAFSLRRPVGVVCAITPFNSPLNTVAHKIAPALAAGNGVVLKPADQTPLTADLLLRVLLDAGLPPGLIAVLYGSGATVGQQLLEDDVPAYYAFTGSSKVGEHIQRTIGARRAQLELGSLSSTFVCADANLDRAAQICVNAGFRKAGQVCTSVQRLYVHAAVVDEFIARLVAGLKDKPIGDPRSQQTFMGPVISTAAADRIEAWTAAAVDRGAQVITSGHREDNLIHPTLLTEVHPTMTVMCQEVFGPVVSIRPFRDLDEALTEADDTPYGLAAGIFTADISTAMAAASRLTVGTLHINESSSARVDLMPFGGVKRSGYGHEGPAYATRSMTDETLITIGSP